MQHILPLADGKALRDIGMQKAQESTEHLYPGWTEQARAYCLRFIEQQGSVPFMTEYMRAWCHARGLPKPNHLRA